MKLSSYLITIDGLPYLGEHSTVAVTHPRASGWTGLSPVTRSRISLGHQTQQAKIIEGRRNLRSELERILTEIDGGLQVKQITISRF